MMGFTRGGAVFQGVALAGLLGALLGLPAPSAPSTSGADASSSINWRAMGHLSSPNGKLLAGCHRHRYSYRITPPSSEWDLETFLIGPRGARLASDVILSGADRKSGTKYFTICRSNTRPGVFTIKAKLTYTDYPAEPSGWISPTHFRLARP